MNEAIALAIEKGGYKPELRSKPWDYFCSFKLGTPADHLVLDPLFWQALAKAIGEEKKMYWLTPAWQYHSHRYFDLIMASGDTEKFWKELIKHD